MESSTPKKSTSGPDECGLGVENLSRNEQVLIEALSEIEYKCEQVGNSITTVHSVVSDLATQLNELSQKNESLEKQITQYHKKHRLIIVGLIIVAVIPAIIRAKAVLWP